MKLSVVIPAYNCASFVGQCLSSIRRSTFKDYELIVVDDASRDRTAEAARGLADRVLVQPRNLGCSRARNAGSQAASGEILVFIDADVLVRPDTLEKVAAYFDAHPDVDALTGRLAEEHPNPDFCSQYKNLYMHYIFGLLPERVNFLYGSIHAVRARLRPSYDPLVPIANDTELGQRLAEEGRVIAYLNDLEVVHLKRYTFRSLMRNDFQVPYSWTNFFLRHRGYRQLWKRKSGYLHSPKEQILSILTMPFILVTALGALAGRAESIPALAILLAAWVLVNARFHFFLAALRGTGFGLRAVGMTFVDHIVMMSALAWGFAAHGARRLRG